MAAKTATKPVAIVTGATLDFVRETKNTVLYKAGDETAAVQSFYVAKTAFPDGNFPARLVLDANVAS